MGYSTSYNGILKFTTDLTTKELQRLTLFLGEDIRDHPIWVKVPYGKELAKYAYNINLEIADDFSGLQWNGAEKTSGMVEAINFVIAAMKQTYKDFGLKGKLICQGEDIDDRWILFINDKGFAEKLNIEHIIKIIDNMVECPKCNYKFKVKK